MPVSLVCTAAIVFGLVYCSDAMKATMIKDMNNQQEIHRSKAIK